MNENDEDLADVALAIAEADGVETVDALRDWLDKAPHRDSGMAPIDGLTPELVQQAIEIANYCIDYVSVHFPSIADSIAVAFVAERIIKRGTDRTREEVDALAGVGIRKAVARRTRRSKPAANPKV